MFLLLPAACFSTRVAPDKVCESCGKGYVYEILGNYPNSGVLNIECHECKWRNSYGDATQMDHDTKHRCTDCPPGQEPNSDRNACVACTTQRYQYLIDMYKAEKLL